MFDISILEDPATAWAYLRRVVEGSHPIINKLLEAGLDVTDLAQAIAEQHDRLPQDLLDSTQARRQYDPRPDLDRAQRFGWRLINCQDDEWPSAFVAPFVTQELNIAHLNSAVRGLRHAPFAVYAKGGGHLRSLANHAVTVVGTRAVSRYGAKIATEWSGQFASQGITVVSGGADGIDARAHRAALDGEHPTIAVMAGALDKPYPKKNVDMLRRIVDTGGVVLSEYPPDTAPARHRFLTRNRLVAALGGATLVVEAAPRSGALNTLNWSNSMGKPTFALPGPVDTINSQGCLKAIQEQRAQLARTVDDVLESIGAAQLALDTSSEQQGPQLSWEQTAVYDAAYPAATAEKIQEDCGLPMPMVIRHLRTLNSQGLITRVGNMWHRQ